MELKVYISSVSNNLKQNMEHLNDLDQKIGDGDHGTNICRGFEEILKNEEKLKGTYKEIFNYIAMTLISKVGGSSGPLLGTMSMQMAKVLEDNNTPMNWLNGFKGALEGLKMRGKAEVGEATMVDSLDSAIKSMEKYEGTDIKEFFSLAADGAKNGANATIDMIATKGRASYLKERSVGHMDPGAYSIYLILNSIKETI